MKLDDFIQFFTTAGTKDIVFTAIIFAIVLITVIGNLYVIFNIKRWLHRIEDELRIVSRHLAHIDPKYYTTTDAKED